MFSWLANYNPITSTVNVGITLPETLVVKKPRSIDALNKNYTHIPTDLSKLLDQTVSDNQKLLAGFEKKITRLKKISSMYKLETKADKKLDIIFNKIKTTLDTQQDSIEKFYNDYQNKHSTIDSEFNPKNFYQYELYKYYLAVAAYESARDYLLYLENNKYKIKNKLETFNKKFWGINDNSVHIKLTEQDGYYSLTSFEEVYEFFLKNGKENRPLEDLENRFNYLLNRCHEKGWLKSNSYNSVVLQLEARLQDPQFKDYQFKEMTADIENKTTPLEKYVIYVKLNNNGFDYLTDQMTKPGTILKSQINNLDTIDLQNLKDNKDNILEITAKKKHTVSVVDYYKLEIQKHYATSYYVPTYYTTPHFSISSEIYVLEDQINMIGNGMNEVTEGVGQMILLSSSNKDIKTFIKDSRHSLHKAEISIYQYALERMQEEANTILKAIDKQFAIVQTENIKLNLAGEGKEDFKIAWSHFSKKYKDTVEMINLFSKQIMYPPKHKKAKSLNTQFKCFKRQLENIEFNQQTLNDCFKVNNILANDVEYKSQPINNTLKGCQNRFVFATKQGSAPNLNLFARKTEKAKLKKIKNNKKSFCI